MSQSSTNAPASCHHYSSMGWALWDAFRSPTDNWLNDIQTLWLARFQILQPTVFDEWVYLADSSTERSTSHEAHDIVLPTSTNKPDGSDVYIVTLAAAQQAREVGGGTASQNIPTGHQAQKRRLIAVPLNPARVVKTSPRPNSPRGYVWIRREKQQQKEKKKDLWMWQGDCLQIRGQQATKRKKKPKQVL